MCFPRAQAPKTVPSTHHRGVHTCQRSGTGLGCVCVCTVCVALCICMLVVHTYLSINPSLPSLCVRSIRNQAAVVSPHAATHRFTLACARFAAIIFGIHARACAHRTDAHAHIRVIAQIIANNRSAIYSSTCSARPFIRTHKEFLPTSSSCHKSSLESRRTRRAGWNWSRRAFRASRNHLAACVSQPHHQY